MFDLLLRQSNLWIPVGATLIRLSRARQHTYPCSAELYDQEYLEVTTIFTSIFLIAELRIDSTLSGTLGRCCECFLTETREKSRVFLLGEHENSRLVAE